jgi:hypothetical protein
MSFDGAAVDATSFPQTGTAVKTPKCDSAQEAVLIGDTGHALRKGEIDQFCVSATDIKVIPIEGMSGLVNGFCEEAVPVFLSVFLQALYT